MNIFQTAMLLLFAFLAVFAETVFSAPRTLLGAQIDLLPALMVFAALNSDLVTISLLALLGGLWFDSLSANPLGVTILPLILVGFPIYLRRDLILRGLPFAQFVLGAAASALVPVLALLILLSSGRQPLIGWGSLWQWLVMTAGGAAATPLIFALCHWGDRTLGYQPRVETSFRPDREIQRGRNKKPEC
jgi:cell shape-determining protein MreD